MQVRQAVYGGNLLRLGGKPAQGFDAMPDQKLGKQATAQCFDGYHENEQLCQRLPTPADAC